MMSVYRTVFAAAHAFAEDGLASRYFCWRAHDCALCRSFLAPIVASVILGSSFAGALCPFVMALCYDGGASRLYTPPVRARTRTHVVFGSLRDRAGVRLCVALRPLLLQFLANTQEMDGLTIQQLVDTAERIQNETRIGSPF